MTNEQFEQLEGFLIKAYVEHRQAPSTKTRRRYFGLLSTFSILFNVDQSIIVEDLERHCNSL